MVSVFGVKARAFDQIETTTDDIAGSEGWSVHLQCAILKSVSAQKPYC